MVTHISRRQTQFSYFDQLLEGPVWKGSKILDFGGNVGGFLVSAGNHVDHDDYWCLDLTEGAIEQGRWNFPRAHFVYYNRYSSYFNPNGVRNLPVPGLGLKFDIILAFSVFTHTHQNEMLELVEQLCSMLVPQGVFAFTFCDPCYDRSLSDPGLPSGTGVLKMFEWQQAESPSLEIEGMVETARHPNWCVVSMTNSMSNRAMNSASKNGGANLGSPIARTLPSTIWGRSSRTQKCFHRSALNGNTAVF